MKKKNPFLIYAGMPKGIYILFISRVIDNMGSVVMPMITLILTQKIGFSKSETGILATVFMFTQAPFLLLGGKLVDRMGSKRVIVLFHILGAIAYIPCGFMKPHIAMALLIALASNLFSVASPAYNSIVTEVADEKRLKSAYSILYLGYNLGFAVGPALAGFLFNKHLNLLFFIDSFTCIISTMLVYFFVPETSESRKRKAKNENRPPERRSSVFRFLFNSPALLIFSGIFLVYNFCYSQWGFMLPLQAAGIFKEEGAKYYSFLVSTNAITVILLTPLLTTLTHKFKPLVVIASGGLFYFSSFIIFGYSEILGMFLAGAVILTIGEILININSNIYVAQQTPQEYIGRANSLLSLINGAGAALGPIIMGHVLLVLNYSSAWLCIAVLMFAGCTTMFMLNKNKFENKMTKY